MNLRKEERIRILVVEPGKAPETAQIPNTLEAMQQIVGGLIQPVTLDDNICLVCNEEGKLLGMEGNRRLGNDIIVGTFFVAAVDGEEFSSLNEECLSKYSELFAQPQSFTQEEIRAANRMAFYFW